MFRNPLEERGVGGFATHAIRFFKKSSLRALCAHRGTKSKRAQKRAEMLHHPCILGGPQQGGQDQSGPKRGRKCYITPAFSGFPKQRGAKSELAA